MNSFVTSTLGWLCVVGTLAAAAPGARAAQGTGPSAASQPLGSAVSGIPGDAAAPRATNQTSTRGLSFLRASSHPTWVVDVMLELVPWSLGGSAYLPAAVTGNPVRWVSREGRPSAGVALRVARSALTGSVDDRTDLWADAEGADGRADEDTREHGSDGYLAGLEFAESWGSREYGRGDLPVREPHEDRVDGRYHDLR